jgi:hypothetical protein
MKRLAIVIAILGCVLGPAPVQAQASGQINGT